MHKSFENLIILLLLVAGGLSLLLLYQLRCRQRETLASESESKVIKSIGSKIAFRRNYVGAYPRVLFHATKQAALAKYNSPDKRKNLSDSRNLGDPRYFVPSYARDGLNELTFLRTFPDASFTDVVRPNLQTLYGSAWLDLDRGPVALYIPCTGIIDPEYKKPLLRGKRRYLSINFLDEYTNVIFRTGSEYYDTYNESRFIVARPKTGAAPKLCDSLDKMAGNNISVTAPETPREDFVSGTRFVWVIIRIECKSEKEYSDVRAYQDWFTMLPLPSAESSRPPPPVGKLISTPPLLILDDSDKWPVFSERTKKLLSPQQDSKMSTFQLSPPEVVAQLSMEEFFGPDFSQTCLDYQNQIHKVSDLRKEMSEANRAIAKYATTMGTNILNNGSNKYCDLPSVVVDGKLVTDGRCDKLLTTSATSVTPVSWRVTLNPTRIGRYSNAIIGTTASTGGGSGGDHLMDRAAVAMTLLGANLPEDSLYASATTDSDDELLTTNCKYRIDFPDGAPKNRAFWSLTAYDSKGYLLKNTPNQKYSVSSSNLINSFYSVDTDDKSNLPFSVGVGNFASNCACELNLSASIKLPVSESVDGENFNLVLRIYAPDGSLLSVPSCWRYPIIKRFK